MAVEVILPKVDMDMVTGRISKWFVEEGGTVARGDVLFEIETDKAAMEIDAPASGTLAHVTGRPGLDIAVGAPVAWILEPGEKAAPAPPSPPAAQAVKTEGPPDLTAAVIPEPPEARGIDKPRATPLARRLARETGINLAEIAGSGPRGRIVKADLEPLLSAPRMPVADAGEAGEPGDNLPFEAGTFDLAPHSQMRRTIARRLVASVTTVPHFYLSASCRIDALLKLRRELNAGAPPDSAWKITVNDMVIKALAAALMEVPEANVTWTDEAMLHHHHADIGVAVPVPGGLLTPVVRKVETKSLSAISAKVRDFATRGKSQHLAPAETRGGSTTVSNLGMYGIEQFSAIINPPHSSILAVGQGERQPVFADESDRVTGATAITVTLAADHRAIDGVLAARLLAAFKTRMEEPLQLVV